MCGSVRYRDADTTVPATCPADPSNCIEPASARDSHVEMASNILSRWYELTVHQTVDVKEFRDLFDYPLYTAIL
jgi:hypothetical protein